MGLDIYLVEGLGKNFDDLWMYADMKPPSDKYPAHLFTKTYIRSSYNKKGFNRIVNINTGNSLENMFEPCSRMNEDIYTLRPTQMELFMCRENVNNAYRKFKNTDIVYSTFVTNFREKDIRVEDAIDIYRKEKKFSTDNGVHNFSYKNGEFYFKETPNIKAIIPGKDALNREGVYVLMDMETSFYEQGFEIILEFIDYALIMEKPTILWSG